MAAMENAREQQTSYAQQAVTLEEERTSLLEEAREATETAKHLGAADNLFTQRRGTLERAVNEATDILGHADADLRSLLVQKENAESSAGLVASQVSAKGRPVARSRH